MSESESAYCCPPNSLAFFKDDYNEKGAIVNVNGIESYAVGITSKISYK